MPSRAILWERIPVRVVPPKRTVPEVAANAALTASTTRAATSGALVTSASLHVMT